MLHLILNSPFQSQALAEALSYLQPEDELVLMQDAVIAASAPQWSARLAGIPLYVMQEDLQARGLLHRVGNGEYGLARGVSLFERQQHQVGLLPWQVEVQALSLGNLVGQPGLPQAFLPGISGALQRLPGVAAAQRRMLLALQQ